MKSFLVFAGCLVLGLALLSGSAEAAPQATQDCGFACAAVYSPVCGKDGSEYRTFSSDCQMGIANCNERKNFQQVKTGEC